MKLLAILLSSVLTIFAFPSVFFRFEFPDLGFLALFCLVPLLALVKSMSLKRSFWTAFACSFLFYAGILYWVFNAIHYFGNLSVLPSLGGEVAMLLILSSYAALAFGVSKFISSKTKVSFYAILPFAWIAQNFSQNYFPVGGYPWASLSYTQSSSLALIQIADIGGPYIVTFLLIFLNAALARLLVKESGAIRQLILAFLMIGIAIGYGKFRLNELELIQDELPIIKVALLQGNIPQDEKWLKYKASEINKIHRDLMSQAGAVDLAVWPESSYPYNFTLRPDEKQFFPLPIRTFHTDTVLGSVTHYEADRMKIYNSAVHIKRGGEIASVYHKMHLVPFGEHIPYAKLFFFIEKIVTAIGDFQEGQEYTSMQIGDHHFGTIICFEDLFPEHTRGLVNAGAEFLVNISNDAWYLYSSAPFQHQVLSQFRAIENRRPLVRAANTGFTSIIDFTGRVVQRSELFERSIMHGELRIGGPRTFYTHYGDLFAWTCIIMLIILFILALLGRGPRRGGGKF